MDGELKVLIAFLLTSVIAIAAVSIAGIITLASLAGC